jgi:hypothetical protein
MKSRYSCLFAFIRGSIQLSTEGTRNREWTLMNTNEEPLFVSIRVHSWLRTQSLLQRLWLMRFELTN